MPVEHIPNPGETANGGNGGGGGGGGGGSSNSNSHNAAQLSVQDMRAVVDQLASALPDLEVKIDRMRRT